jgi:hypothetical protein
MFENVCHDADEVVSYPENNKDDIDSDTDAVNGGVNEMEIDDEIMADEMVVSSSSDVNSGKIFYNASSI